jgi:uncharacterized membrane protein
MRTLTFLSGASVGAGLMYLLDPDRGNLRRAELRDTLTELGESELVERALERARRMEPLAAARDLGGDMLERASGWRAADAQAALARAARRSGLGDWAALGRRRPRRGLDTRDWALLGGLIGATAVGIWLTRRAASVGTGVEVVRTMTIDAPVERVYEFWNDFENFPRFMSHVREVRRTGADRTHWVVAGPGGAPIEWDAVLTERVPNERIAWRTVEGALVEHHGEVRFWPAGAAATRVEVRMTYRPVGGALGHGVASLLGNDPDRVIGEDLTRLAAQLRGPRPAVGETGTWR